MPIPEHAGLNEIQLQSSDFGRLCQCWSPAGVGLAPGHGAAFQKHGRELKGVMYAGASLGACKAVGQKAHLRKRWRLKEEGCFLASFPLSSCCSQRSRSSARTPLRHPSAPERALWAGKRRVRITALCGSSSAVRPSAAQPETPRSCRTRSRRGSGHLARHPRDKEQLSRWSWTCCWGLRGCRPKLLFPSKLTSPLAHSL